MQYCIKDLINQKCKQVSKDKGVYIVKCPKDMKIVFNDMQYNRNIVPYDKNILQNKYSLTNNEEILYIGKAEGKKGLYQRIWQYIKTGCHNGTNHKGGRGIFQINNYENLIIETKSCDNAREEERKLLEKFKKIHNGNLPVANRRL